MDLLSSLNIKFDHKRDFVLFRKHKHEIVAALQQGYTRSQIFRVMVLNYNLTISYSTFVRWIKRDIVLEQNTPVPGPQTIKLFE